MSLKSPAERQKILERADNEFSKETQKYLESLIYQIADGKRMYRFTKIDSSMGLPEGCVLTIAVYDYYLNHPELLKYQ